jgi:hypothetical protein
MNNITIEFILRTIIKLVLVLSYLIFPFVIHTHFVHEQCEY